MPRKSKLAVLGRVYTRLLEYLARPENVRRRVPLGEVAAKTHTGYQHIWTHANDAHQFGHIQMTRPTSPRKNQYEGWEVRITQKGLRDLRTAPSFTPKSPHAVRQFIEWSNWIQRIMEMGKGPPLARSQFTLIVDKNGHPRFKLRRPL